MKLFNLSMIVVVCLTVQYVLNLNSVAAKGSFGPYRSTIVRSERCAKPSRPYEKVPTATFYAEIYNTTRQRNLMRGNATILRDNRNLVMRLKSFYWENGKWQMSYRYNNVGCKGMMTTVLVTLIGLKYDRKTCSAAKGSFKFENIDFNKIDHKWTSEREYGKLMWIAEVSSKAGVVACWETETVVDPA